MKAKNEAVQTVRRHGVEHVLYCLGVNPEELHRIARDDPEQYERIMKIRNAMSRQLARNLRNVAFED